MDRAFWAKTHNTMTKIIFDNLSKSDARKLAKWWNANTDGYYFIKSDDNHKGRFILYQQ